MSDSEKVYDKHANYEATAKRKTILNVRTSKGDDVEAWEKIKNWLDDLGDGNAKMGIYNLAKKHKIIK